MKKQRVIPTGSFLVTLALALALGCGKSATPEHGQNIDCAEPNTLPPAETIYTNSTSKAIDVTGDLKVEADSCTVRVSYGGEEPFDVAAGKTDSRTVSVAGKSQIVGHCKPTEGKTKCHWSYRRTSP